MQRRLTRVEQVERNRERLLQAARAVFLEKGYGAASVEEIAESAGFSRGVIYSQFDSKADLFLALLEARIAERAAQNDAIAQRASGAEAVREIIRRGEADALREPGWPLLLVEFRALAARDPALGARYARAHEQTIERLSATLQQTAPVSGLDARRAAQLILALSTGMALERAADAKALPTPILEAAVLRLVGH